MDSPLHSGLGREHSSTRIANGLIMATKGCQTVAKPPSRQILVRTWPEAEVRRSNSCGTSQVLDSFEFLSRAQPCFTGFERFQ